VVFHGTAAQACVNAGALSFPLAGVGFVAYCWWEITFVIALPFYMPLEFLGMTSVFQEEKNHHLNRLNKMD